MSPKQFLPAPLSSERQVALPLAFAFHHAERSRCTTLTPPSPSTKRGIFDFADDGAAASCSHLFALLIVAST